MDNITKRQKHLALYNIPDNKNELSELSNSQRGFLLLKSIIDTGSTLKQLNKISKHGVNMKNVKYRNMAPLTLLIESYYDDVDLYKYFIKHGAIVSKRDINILASQYLSVDNTYQPKLNAIYKVVLNAYKRT